LFLRDGKIFTADGQEVDGIKIEGPKVQTPREWTCPQCHETMTTRQKGVHIAREKKAIAAKAS